MKGRTVLVTGASSGIGRATALRFAGAGADLVLAARRQGRLEEVAAEVRGRGVRALAVGCDVTVGEDVERLLAATDREFGGLDVLVNNAGLINGPGPVAELPLDEWRRVFEVNVFGLMRVTRAALPLLRRRAGAAIVNVSSVLGYRGLPLLGGYGASKAAVNALSESLRTELAAEHIFVAVVSPGLTETEFRASRLSAEGYEQETLPLKAMSADDVARAIVQASRTGRRDTVLTLAGRAMVYGNRVAPALFDLVAGRMVGAPKEKGR